MDFSARVDDREVQAQVVMVAQVQAQVQQPGNQDVSFCSSIALYYISLLIGFGKYI